MNTIKFECEIITPMFLAGADGKTPELRPPSSRAQCGSGGGQWVDIYHLKN